MKKKGFTLIELLAVIIVLAVLAMILVPVIQDLIANARYASAANSALNYVNAANTQAAVDVGGFEEFSLNLSNSRLETGVTDSELAKIEYKGKGPDYVYLHFTDDGKLVDWGNFCIWGYSIDYTLEEGAARSNNDYCEPRAVVKDEYETGDAIYYNVTLGTSCTKEQFEYNVSEWGSHANYMYIADQLVSRGLGEAPEGLHEGCMKFYSIADDGTNVTLLTAFNINEIGPDKNETDPDKFGDRTTYWADIKDGETAQNVKDFNNITNPQPNTYYVMDLLKDYTKDWKVNEVKEDYTSTYTYTVDDNEVTDSYTIPYKTDGYKARLLTKAEAEAIASSDRSAILQDYTNQHPYGYILHPNGSRTIIEGYYTSDAVNATDIYAPTAWRNPNGTSSSSEFGVRPVIEISKNNLKNVDPITPKPKPTIAEGSGTGGGSGSNNVYTPGTEIYFNVTTGTECTKGEADINLSSRHTPVGVNSGCMKFYTLPDSSNKDTVSLLLDHPITNQPIYWWYEAGSTFGNYVTLLPPITLLTQMYNDTKDWVGVEPIENRVMDVTQGNQYQWRFINVIPYKDMGLKARLITTEEMDLILHNDPNYVDDYSSDNPRKEFSYYNGMSGTIGSWNTCGNTDPSRNTTYDPNCNRYGVLGYSVGSLSWLITDYTRFRGAATNEPGAEYLDLYDGYSTTYSSPTGNYNAGCFWTSNYAISDTNQVGPYVTVICDGPRWTNDDYGNAAHLYRPVVEVKKNKIGGTVKDNDIEVVVGTSTNYGAGGSYSILDSTIASVDGSGNITGLKIGVTQVKSSTGHYAKVIVKKPANTYYSNIITAYYNVTTGTECTQSEYSCSSTSGCKQVNIVGETPSGNYLVGVSDYNWNTTPKYWSAKYAIDEDSTAESKYGVMAYNHWYRTIEYVADYTKNWVVDEYPKDYIDYTTKEYVIPWGTPAYYENSNPVYSKARLLTLEDAANIIHTTQTGTYAHRSVYEILHNTGSSVYVNYAYNTIENDYSTPVIGYLSPMANQDSPGVSFSEYIIAVSKSRITNLDGYETYNSTASRISLYKSYNWVQTSSDGGSIDIQSGNDIFNFGYPKTNGHVHLVGTPDSGNGNTIVKDIYINLQYSCGQVDSCGNTTPACN